MIHPKLRIAFLLQEFLKQEGKTVEVRVVSPVQAGALTALAVADVELDGKGLPILLRQYAKIGGKMLGFNVDRKFSNVLDGLVVVDLRRTEPAVLERYMGKESAARFVNIHGRAVTS